MGSVQSIIYAWFALQIVQVLLVYHDKALGESLALEAGHKYISGWVEQDIRASNLS